MRFFIIFAIIVGTFVAYTNAACCCSYGCVESYCESCTPPPLTTEPPPPPTTAYPTTGFGCDNTWD